MYRILIIQIKRQIMIRIDSANDSLHMDRGRSESVRLVAMVSLLYSGGAIRCCRSSCTDSGFWGTPAPQ